VAEAKAATPNEAVVRKLPPVPLTPTSRERLNRSAERSLKRGTVAIGDRLDLHGLDREQAHRAVSRFLTRLADDGERVALVITGKGGRSAGMDGVLRAEFPRWLSESPLARLVLAWRPAAPRHGGDGAFYVLLRRKGARP
jgi:DNA-nicking Smr family endonuclease